MRLSRYAFLMLVAFVAHPAFARCEFKDSRQQQQCIQQEQAQLRAQQQRQQEQQRQQQVAQQQRQQQAQQQAQQRAQEQQRQQEILRQQQEQSRRVQEQQRHQFEAQQRAAQERQRQDEAARKQQEAAARQGQQQRAFQRQQEQLRATASTASRTAGMTAVTLGNGQRVFANSQGMFFDASGNQISHQSVATATKGAPAIGPSPQMPIRVQPAQAADTYRRSLTVASPNAPIAASPAPNRVVVIPPSIQTANTSAYQASSAPPARAPIAVQPTTTFAPPTPRPAPAQEIGIRPTASVGGPPSAQELQKYGVEQLASMPREKLVNLSADQRHHLNNYLSGKANAAKYDAEAKQYKKIEQTLAPLETAAKIGVVAGDVAQVGLAITATAASGGLGSTAGIVARRVEKAAIPKIGEYVVGKFVQREVAKEGGTAVLKSEVGSAAARRLTVSDIDKQAEKQATAAAIKEGAKTASQIDRAAFRTERETFWKAEAKANPTKYSAENTARMEGGKPPIGRDGYPIELHHKDRTMSGELEPLTRTDHRLGENFKKNHPND